MKLTRLLILAAAAAYVYKRFVVDAHAGEAETAAAQPFSSDELADAGGAAPAAAAEPAASAPAQPSEDTLEKPTWLDPADAGPSSAA